MISGKLVLVFYSNHILYLLLKKVVYSGTTVVAALWRRMATTEIGGSVIPELRPNQAKSQRTKYLEMIPKSRLLFLCQRLL